MELNDDLLYLIAGFSDDIVTVVSKTMRDGYFSKRGIWVHLGMTLKTTVSFPKEFYKYKINMNVELAYTDGGMRYFKGNSKKLLVFLMEELGKTYNNCDDNLIDHIVENTKYINNLSLPDLVSFKGLTKTAKTYGYFNDENIDMLEKTKISGCRLIIYPGDDNIFPRLKRIKDVDYQLQLFNGLKISNNVDIDNLVLSLTTVDIGDIIPDKIYPRITKIITDEINSHVVPERLSENFHPKNYPKLKKIIIYPDLFDWVVDNIENVKIKILYQEGSLDASYYQIISEKKLDVTLVLYNDDIEVVGSTINRVKHNQNMLDMKKYGVGYLSVIYEITYAGDDIFYEEIMYAINYYVDFHLCFDVTYTCNVSILLGYILKNLGFYDGQIVRFKNFTLHDENIIGLAIQIWEEKNLYIDLDYIGFASYDDIQKYKNYRPKC